MKNKSRGRRPTTDLDTARHEYDFSNGVRGGTAARYAAGANMVVVAPDVLDVFPNGASVNEALRALAPILRHQPRRKSARQRSS